MHKFRRNLVAGKLAVLGAAALLSASAPTVVLGGPVGGPAHGHAHLHRGIGAPLFNQAPSLPPPVFNPSAPYTAPVAPEVPVSPASPGSVFGNGPSNR